MPLIKFLINKNKIKSRKILMSYFKTLNTIELVKYLMNSHIIDDTKLVIKELMDSNKIYFITEETKKYLDKFNLQIEDILTTTYPSCMTSYILNKFKQVDIDQVFESNNLELQKRIIDQTNGYNLLKIIMLKPNEDLMSYILDTKFNEKDNISEVLDSYQIAKDLKLKIIKNNITKNNILEVMTNLYNKDIIGILLKEKSYELEKAILSIDINNLASYLIHNFGNDMGYEYLLRLREKDILKCIAKLNDTELIKFITYIKSEDVGNIINNMYLCKIENIIMKYPNINLLEILSNNYVSDEIKSFIMENKLPKLKEVIKKKTAINIKLYYLRDDVSIPDKLKELMVEMKEKELLEDLKDKTPKDITSDILFGSYCSYYKALLIKNKIDKDNVITLINRADNKLWPEIKEYALDILKSYVSETDLDKVIKMYDFDNESIKNEVVFLTKDIIKKRLLEIPKIDRYKLLYNYETLQEIKIIILESIGINKDKINICLELIKNNDIELALDNYNLVEDFFSNTLINIYTFIQYGSGSNINDKWLSQVIDIMHKGEKNNFFKIFDYLLHTLYVEDLEKENMVYYINDFLKVLNGYTYNKELLDNLYQTNKYFDEYEKVNLDYLLKTDKTCDSLSNIDNIRVSILKEYEDKINNASKIDKLKKIFMELLLGKENNTLKSIGGSSGIIYIKNNNRGIKGIEDICDELLKYTKVLDSIAYSSNLDKIKEVLTYLVKHPQNLMKLQNIFNNFDELTRLLFETESMVNLSKLSKAESLKDEKLSQEYGGKVYDFRGVNYCLYAHVQSRFESVENLVNGIANSRQNFISISPISYLGQKYYFDKDELTLAYDTIPKGSFICSSISNMSTNYYIMNNSTQANIPKKKERGVLETSAVKDNNSEILLYRENVKPCGIILRGGKTPSQYEMEVHEKYDLPFILTQDCETVIENPQVIFRPEDITVSFKKMSKEVETLLDFITFKPSIIKDSIYTGRVIAFITDAHSMYEPTIAVLEDIKKQGIKEIYSLGDNIGLGPNPHETLNLLADYNVLSIAGNSEYYSTLGIAPFTYFNQEKIDNQDWTYNQLSVSDLNYLKTLKPSLDIKVGNSLVGLCHFGNDIRIDYLGNNSTWSYLGEFKEGEKAKQFLNTNSATQLELIKNHLENIPANQGYIDAFNNPLFDGKMITDYSHIIQGHVHFHLNDFLDKTRIDTLRAVAMGYSEDDLYKACYYILKEKNDGTFDIEKRLVPFNHQLLLAKIESCGIPHKDTILKYTRAK